MKELTQEEKDKIQKDSLTAIEQVARLNGRTLSNISKEEFKMMFDCFIAGVIMFRDILKKQEELIKEDDANLEF